MFAAVRKVCQLKVICIKIPLYLFPYMSYLGTGSCTLWLTKLRSQKYQSLILSPPHIVFTKFHCEHIAFHLHCLCNNIIIYLFLWIFIPTTKKQQTRDAVRFYPQGSNWQQLGWTHNGIFWGEQSLCMKPLLQTVQQQHLCKAQCILLMTKLHGWLLWRECRHPAW